MQYFNENEIDNVWGQVYERSKQENVTITDYTYWVTNEAGVIVQVAAAASLQDDGTELVLIYGLIDTTASGFILENYYDVHFQYTIGTSAPLHKIIRFRYENRPLT